MTDPVKEALAWLGTALMCNLEGEEVEAARFYMVEAGLHYAKVLEEVARLKSQVQDMALEGLVRESERLELYE